MSIFGTPQVKFKDTVGTSVNTTFNTALGDLIVVGCCGFTITASVSDSAGNSYTAQTLRTGGSRRMQWFWTIATHASATNTVTATFNSNGGVANAAFWDFPTSGTPSFDTDTDSHQNTSSPVASPSFNTAAGDELILALCGQDSGYSDFVAGSGYTLGPLQSDLSFNRAAAEYGIFSNGPSTSITAGFTYPDSSTTTDTFAICFKAPPTVPNFERILVTPPGLPLTFQSGDIFTAPSKFGLIVAVPPTIANWTPTLGQKAVFLNYEKPNVVNPPKFGLLNIATTFLPARISTDGLRAVRLNYNLPESLTSPAKFGLTSIVINRNYVNLSGKIQFAIDPLGYIKFIGTVAQPVRQFINLAATVASKNNFYSVNLAGQIQVVSRNPYIILKGTLQLGSRNYVRLAGTIANPTRNFINLSGTIVQKITKGPCGTFPDAAFINLAGWIVNPASTNDSRQMPNQGFTLVDDWLSSNDALNSYKPTSRFTIFGSTLPSAGISILVTAFTAGVVSFQTRTRNWLRRVDQASSGILINTKVNTHTLPNGSTITTTTQTVQQQDTLVTTVTIRNSGTPTRTSTIITEKTASGQSLTREIETDTINGIINSKETKTLLTKPPTQDNIQPLQIRTLDGVIHYQFFGTVVNNEWAGGDQEGLTTTTRKVQIVPGTLNGKTTDTFGNLIYNQMTDETETDPTGKVIQTHTEEIGTRKDIGTITTDTAQQFTGLLVNTTKTVTFPDGSTKVTKTVTNPVTGDSVQTTTENVTDEFGQLTTTVTNEETKTFPDPTTGIVRQTVTKTVNVTKGSVTTTDTSVDTTTDFEDDIIRNKVKVYFIQEFTITCVIDEFSMQALSEINITHQRNYALLELFGQQLGNANLSYVLRQQLIKQFNTANSCISPVTLQALGRNYSVVFAQSASGFRAKYIPGTEPHVYELQMIFQERSDLMNGAFGG